jgi:hypothetical protein
MPFTGLDLPSRAGSALTRNGITNADTLVSLNARELRALPGVGPSTVNQVLDALAAADLVLAEDPWAPYVCARDSRQASDVDLATFFLCALCATQYANGAFSGAQPEWQGTQLIEGYCGHCNKLRSDISVVQWLLCGVCERVVRSIGRGRAAARYVVQVWEQSIASQVSQIVLRETDPPELRPRGRRSDPDRKSLADFTGFSIHKPGTALFGLELKSGKNAAAASGGIGTPMARFQLDTTDCDDILSVVAREGIPVYLVHAQVMGRAFPPTERFNGVGFWWTDLWAMYSHFKYVEIRPRETRNAAYYDTRMFRALPSLAEHLSSGGHILDRERLRKEGQPNLYRSVP